MKYLSLQESDEFLFFFLILKWLLIVGETTVGPLEVIYKLGKRRGEVRGCNPQLDHKMSLDPKHTGPLR